MISHKKIKEVLQNWGLEKEKLVDVVFAEQEKYAELYETNKQMTEWMLQNFGDMNFKMLVF